MGASSPGTELHKPIQSSRPRDQPKPLKFFCDKLWFLGNSILWYKCNQIKLWWTDVRDSHEEQQTPFTVNKRDAIFLKKRLWLNFCWIFETKYKSYGDCCSFRKALGRWPQWSKGLRAIDLQTQAGGRELEYGPSHHQIEVSHFHSLK